MGEGAHDATPPPPHALRSAFYGGEQLQNKLTAEPRAFRFLIAPDGEDLTLG